MSSPLSPKTSANKLFFEKLNLLRKRFSPLQKANPLRESIVKESAQRGSELANLTSHEFMAWQLDIRHTEQGQMETAV